MEVPPAAAPANLKVSDVIVSKVQRHVDSLRDKNLKLVADNARLKQQLSDFRNANTRIRRIPKKPKEATDETATA